MQQQYKTVERVSMEPKKEVKQPVYKVDKVELSENIQDFDNKPKQEVKDVEQEVLKSKPTPTFTEMIYDPLFNRAGKILGIESISDWSQKYDKVYRIVEEAKTKLKTDSVDKILPWVYKMVNAAPSLTSRKIDDLDIYLKMGGKEEKPKTRIVEKTVVKYIKPRDNTKQVVNKWIKGILNTN